MTNLYYTSPISNYHTIAGIDIHKFAKTREKLRELLESSAQSARDDVSLQRFRGEKYSCTEEMILDCGQVFDPIIETVFPSLPLSKMYKLSQVHGRTYCEGVILPWEGETLIQAEWVFDSKKNSIITRDSGVHFGVGFDQSYLLAYCPYAGQTNILLCDQVYDREFLDFGFPAEARMGFSQ